MSDPIATTTADPSRAKSVFDLEKKTLTWIDGDGEQVVYDLTKFSDNARWWCMARGLVGRLSKPGKSTHAQIYADLVNGVIPSERGVGEPALTMTEQAIVLAMRDLLAKKGEVKPRDKSAYEELSVRAETFVRNMTKEKRKTLRADVAVVEWLNKLKIAKLRAESEKDGRQSLLTLEE